MHTDFTTEAQRHKDEEEIVSPGLPTENSEEPFLSSAPSGPHARAHNLVNLFKYDWYVKDHFSKISVLGGFCEMVSQRKISAAQRNELYG